MVTVLRNWWLARIERVRAWQTRSRRGDLAVVAAPRAVRPDTRASLVLLNWQRPRNTRQILDRYVTFPAIDDVIVWNNNGSTPFEYLHPKVRCINSDEFGLNTRWLACLLARHPCVVVHDDDLICDEPTITGLIGYHAADSDRTYTL